MISVEGAAAKFAHDERLLILRFPFQSIGLVGQTIVPTYIFVATEHVQIFSEWIIYHLGRVIDVMAFHGRRYQPAGVQASGLLD